jgi:hypothetical protein
MFSLSNKYCPSINIFFHFKPILFPIKETYDCSYSSFPSKTLSMTFKIVAITSLLALTGIHASAVIRKDFSAASQYPGFKVLDVVAVPETNGNIVWYGETSPSPPQAPVSTNLRYQCGDNNPIRCDGVNEAWNDLCSLLRDNVSKQGVVLPTSPRSVCYSGDSGSCCASWANDAPDLLQEDLVSGIDAVSMI